VTLATTDLNLLLALKVILEEASVTRAGRRLGLSQPAMSAALARLRRRFDDELLTRSGRDYELTPFAADLLPEVQAAVQLIGEALEVQDEFEPATSVRTFRFTMSDYAISVLREVLLARVSRLAPEVRLQVHSLAPQARASGRILADYDVVVAPLGYGFPGDSRPLWQDRFVVLADQANPRLRDGALTLADVAALPHAVAAFGQGNLTPADRVLAELGVERRVQVQVTGYLPLPFVVEGTEMVAMVPERFARLHARPRGPLVMVEPPFGRVVLAEGYYFAPGRARDAAYRWLLDQLEEAGKAVRGSDPLSSEDPRARRG
jgi:DNA-binding transcriptional LysR family regulator